MLIFPQPLTANSPFGEDAVDLPPTPHGTSPFGDDNAARSLSSPFRFHQWQLYPSTGGLFFAGAAGRRRLPHIFSCAPNAIQRTFVWRGLIGHLPLTPGTLPLALGRLEGECRQETGFA